MLSPSVLLFIPTLLLLLIGRCNASAAYISLPGLTSSLDDALQKLHRRVYSEEMRDKIREYETGSTACMKKCDEQLSDYKKYKFYTPLCSFTNVEDETSKEYINGYSCSCTDKKYSDQRFSCLIRECGANSTEIGLTLGSQYALCKLYADVIYPKPEIFLNELCLLDDFPEGSVPTDVPLIKELWPDYSFAAEWPEKTATTWTPTASGTPRPLEDYIPENIDTDPSWTCVPSPLPDAEEDEDTGNQNTGNGASGGQGRGGLVGMAAVVALVISAATFL